MECDVVIFGGGVAGLWALDELVERGYRTVLLEASALGTGQTVAAQGIVHGGLKYTLQGLLTRSAVNIREMPGIWRDCLAGKRRPDLSSTRIRSPHCFMWRTESVSSKLGMIGARWGLRAAPQSVEHDQLPELLRGCPGTVARVDEPVISTTSMLESFLNEHRARILKIDPTREIGIERSHDHSTSIELSHPETSDRLQLTTQSVILAAGAGNAELRFRLGLNSHNMQRRPLHMVLARGRRLPLINGHCVDGAKTRVTITSDVDSSGRTVWQVGGQVAEQGVSMDAESLIRHTRDELLDAIPGLDLSDVEWGTYRVDRAEGVDEKGRRPDAARVIREGNVVTIWPTKMALAPLASAAALEHIEEMGLTASPGEDTQEIEDWPRPEVASAPWDVRRNWIKWSSELPAQSGRRAA